MRLYDRLFTVPNPNAADDFMDVLNPDSLQVVPDSLVEPSVAGAEPGTVFQFLRMGYFSVDPDTSNDQMVFNRTMTLKDTWAKIQKK